MKRRWLKWPLVWIVTTLALLIVGLAVPVALVTAGARSSAIPQVAGAEDWPTFLHDPQHTAVSGETFLSTSNAPQLTKLWAFKTGGVIAASPAVVAGVVYVGSWDGYEYALNATTGAQLWKTYLGITTPSTSCSPPSAGITSGAAVQNGVVYVGGGDAYWYALDASTGAILWKVYTGDNSVTGGHYNWSSPLLYNGFAYIGIASYGDCPLVQGQLLKVDLSTHLVVGTTNLVPNGNIGGGIWTSPTLDPATNTIYVTTGTETSPSEPLAQAFVAINASSMAVTDSWKLPESQAVTDSDFGNTPTLFTDKVGDQLVVAINKNGVAYAFKRNNLAAGPVWQQSVALGGDCPTCGDGSISTGVFANGLLYMAGGDTSINGVGYPGSVRAYDPATGNPVWQQGTAGYILPALAYTNGLLVDGAGAVFEVRDASTGQRLYSYQTGATLYGAPSISQGDIFEGSVDGSVYAFGLPATTPPPPPDPNCPNGWTCQDIGSPTSAGSETVASGSWNVTAGGAGVKGTADQFRLMTQAVSGDTQINAQVASQSSGGSAQTGLMIRQTADPGSPYYAVFCTQGVGVVVQYRSAWGGGTTTAILSAATLPLYLEIQRVGDHFQAATSTDGSAYTLVSGGSTTLVMPTAVLAGLAASAGSNAASATATYNAVTLGLPTTPPTPVSPSTPCPTNWGCANVGNPALSGNQTLSNGTWTLQAAGNDITGTWDQFLYDWQNLPGDGVVSAHIVSQSNTSSSAKAGVMLRQTTDPGSAYYAVFVTPGGTITVQYRTIGGANTRSIATIAGTVPTYLQVGRTGTTFTAYTSTNGVTWSALAGSSVTVNLTGTVLAGLAVTSHNSKTLGTVTMDTVTAGSAPPPNPCVTGWTCADIGYTAPAGNQALSNGTWTIQGAGNDIWGTADQFHYVWQTLSGDGGVSAQVVTQTVSDVWAKAGVMLRQTSDPGSAYYAVYVTPSNGIAVQYRPSQGASALQAATLSGTVPAYLRVSRVGNTFTAYTSSDGVTWTAVVGSSVTMTMTGPLLAGMAVNSHNGLVLGTVTFSGVQVGTLTCPTGWNCADIGYTTPAGSQTLSSGIWTIQGAGSDIFGTADQFHYVWQALSGDGSVSAQVLTQSNTSSSAKAGVMLRQSADPGSAYYAVYVTPGTGLKVQYRKSQGASAVTVSTVSGTVPAYLRVSRVGNTFTAYTSSDGVTWTAVVGSSVTMTMTGTLLAGLAVTSHHSGVLGTATFSMVSIGTTTCPTGWNCADIGYTAPAGSQTLSNGTWTIQGAGSDIFGTADQFHYVWQTLSGDGSVSAQVVTQTVSDVWAKAGVMLRQSTDPGSAYYAVYVTPGNGIAVQYRPSQGASALQAATLSGTVPVYLEVSRAGSTFTAYTSSDGVTWTAIAGSSVTMTMTGPLLAGLAVTSHYNLALSTVTFSSVQVGVPSNTCPTGWNCADIGYTTPAGSQALSNGAWTVQGAGSDILGRPISSTMSGRRSPAMGA